MGKTTPKKKPASKFVMAGDGKANCAGKGAPVKNEKACKAAAKPMKKQFGSSGAYASYPVGCFVYNNKLYFNKGKTGRGNSRARPVCVSGATGGKKTTPKKKPAKKKMVLAGNGKANCAGKGAAIKNDKACRAAANVMKKKFGSSGNFGASFPVGCFVSSANKAVFFNKAKTEKTNKGASPVYVGKATGGKKTTPKKKPAKKM